MLSNADVLTVRSEDIRALVSPSPSFRVWANEAWMRGYLDILVEAIVTTGMATTVEEALTYLQEIYQEQREGTGRVALADFVGRNPWSRLHARLRVALGKVEVGTSDLALMHGTVGHAVLPRLFSSRLKEPNHRVTHNVETHQMSLLFPREDAPTGQMMFSFGIDTHAAYDVAVHAGNGKSVLARNALKRAMRFWVEYRTLVNEGDRARWRSLLPRLRTITTPLFGHYVSRLDRHPAANPEMTFLTLMSWLSALYYWKENPRRILFPEIDTVLRSRSFSGGRVDAVELRKIDGMRLSKKERLLLGSLRELPYRSVGELLVRFQRCFPGVLEIGILDWKFAVGDASVRGEVIKPEEVVSGLLPKHRAQVERYLALAVLDHCLLRGVRHDEEIWEQYGHRLTADVVYLLPGVLPIVHPVAPDSALLKEIFTTSTARSWDSARNRSAIRQANNAVMGHLLRLIEGREKSRVHKNGTSPSSQPTLFDKSTGYVTATDVIEKHKNGRTVDQHGIVLKTVNGGYEMHFDCLIVAIEKGDIATRNFSPEQGGKVSCMFPGHDDSGPSMHIYLDGTPRFFCFGCEARGIIAPRSLPEGFEITPSRFRKPRRPTQTKGETVNPEPLIPEDHHRLFVALQESLARAFHKSEAERYVAYKRRIDPDLAFMHGAGFGTPSALNDLLDAGYTFDELAVAGIIGFSPNVKAEGGVPRILKRRGMRVEDMTRVVKKKPALPYCLLLRRATFPLTFDGQYSNFYARSITSFGNVPHAKLSTHLTQGGFNMPALVDPNCSEVIMTEGAFDALTLITLGYANVFSLIGVLNVELFGSIMRSGKNLAIAFDRDANLYKTGQTKTRKIGSELRAWGFRGRVRDFTEDFVRKLPPEERPPEDGSRKWDFNGWWCDPARRR